MKTKTIIGIWVVCAIAFAYLFGWKYNVGRMSVQDDLDAGQIMTSKEYSEIKSNFNLRQKIIADLDCGWKDFRIDNGKHVWVIFDDDFHHDELMPRHVSRKLIPRIMSIAHNKIGN